MNLWHLFWLSRGGFKYESNFGDIFIGAGRALYKPNFITVEKEYGNSMIRIRYDDYQLLGVKGMVLYWNLGVFACQ